ncbi:reverse transcriptase [Gossypium australe]|uniref:Reverse transcriptase n=1 Tax=Gossypium australe TaxID=47621 RepID=A0A5B6WD12_9ROSI|nr:reverse transcriptase [Gossypium australe]
MEKVRKSCGLLNGIEVEDEGTRGGLWLAWKDDIDVTLRSFSKWHLDVMVKEDGNHEEWRFTGLYGSPYLRDQNVVWNLLKRLSQEGNFPWLVAGDFNEILYSFEKKRGLPRDYKRMEEFRDTLEACNLMDIEFSRAWYTWERGNLPETNIRERLDRGWLMINGRISRRRANSISKLILDNGQEIKEESKIQEEAKVYFENLFTSSGVANPREILKGVEESISIEVNESLFAPFREDEVRKALKGMGPTKAPGPDGFPAVFFQKYWHIVGKEVLGYCLGVLNEGRDADSANTTNIVLIPKVQKPTSFVNFRPISLCRLISDNILIAYEILHTFKQKRTGKKVTINGNRGRSFKPSRGLRQVDPLSPFLFLICSEGLSALMRTSKKERLIRGAKRSNREGGKDAKRFIESLRRMLRKAFLHDFGGRRDLVNGVCTGVNGDFYVVPKKRGLEFRRMAPFNISLLAKQGWRLLNFPHSLVARVFKAKYFLETSFLQSSLGNSGSYVWRSIWATKGSLENGLIWKVGTGAHISISQDIWIPDYASGRLLSSFNNLQCDKVAGLICNNVREWNTFPGDVAELILRIPLSTVPHKDFLAWSEEPSGVFSVSWNYIASKVNLYARKLGNNSVCPRRYGSEETLNHLFRGCPVSAEIWRLLSDMDLATSGVVVRDSKGNVIISNVVIHRGVQTAFEAEAFACRRATQIALEMEKKGSIIEANNLAHVLAVESLRRKEEHYLLNRVPNFADAQARRDSEREPD